MSRRPLRSARHRNQSSGPADVEQVHAAVQRERVRPVPLRRIERSGIPANMSIPQTSNFGVARLDHDFGDKWHFMSSYRYYNLTSAYQSTGGHRRVLPGRHAGNTAVALQQSAAAVVPGGRNDRQHNQQYHQRHSLQLPAQLVGSGAGPEHRRNLPVSAERWSRSAKPTPQSRRCSPTT